MRKESLLDNLLIDWYSLFEQTKEFCAFGDDEDDDWGVPFDYNAFVKCMKEAYHYFFADNERPQNLTPKEIEVYGVIFAYSQLRITIICRESAKFSASALVAEEMANTIRDPNYQGIDGTKLIGLCLNEDGKLFKYKYDIEEGDLSSFMDYASRVGLE